MGSGGRFQTCVSLRACESRLLVDCGSSAMMAVRRFGVDPCEVDAIVVSHLHGDHFGGIPFFLLDARHVSGRTRPLTIAGPPGVAERLRVTMEALFPGSADREQDFELSFVELAGGRAQRLGEAVVTPSEVVHPSGAPSFGLRVEMGERVVGFSGDTEWTDALLEVSRDADLFVCESSDYDPVAPFHLDYHTLLRRRGDFGCKRLVLTHLGAEMIARASELELECAEDGKKIHL